LICGQNCTHPGRLKEVTWLAVGRTLDAASGLRRVLIEVFRCQPVIDELK
jgi:hypothetical protein